MKTLRSIGLLSALLALTAAVGAPVSAGASEIQPTGVRGGEQFLIATATGDRNDLVPPLTDEARAANEREHAFIRMTLDDPELLVSSVEARVGGGYVMYSEAPAKLADAVIRSRGLSDFVEYRPAKLGGQHLEAAIARLTENSGVTPSGHQVVLVVPARDGARLGVTLDERVNRESAVSLPEVGIPIDMTFGSRPEAATRNIAPSSQYPQRYAGAYMQNGTFSCTTGFRFTKTDGSNTPAHGSAHHCGAGGGSSQWNYSSAGGWPIGSFAGGLGSGGAAYGDTALYLGSGAQYLVPGVLTGDHTANGSTVERIRGARATAVGGYVCYSGSRSGTVCNNLIEEVGVSVCYGNGLPCYNNLALTRQTTGIPAVGQGDSGGPVISMGSSEGRFAVGVISGIRNPSQSCTGDGGRQCSPQVIYAPVTEFFGAGWGLNYYP